MGGEMLSPYELGILMRSLAHNPTEEELNAIVQEYDVYVKGGISLHDFLSVMSKREQDTERGEKLFQAFQVFDRDGNGFVNVEALREQMMTLGDDPFTEEEFTLFLSEAQQPGQELVTPDNRLEYTDFVKKCMLKK